MGKKKKQQPVRPRQTTVTMDMGQPVSVTALTRLADGRIAFLDGAGKEHMPIAGVIERSYERDTGKAPKVLSQTALHPEAGIRFHPDDGLLAFPTVFVIDTNTRPQTGLSACCMATLFPQRGGKYFIQGMEFANASCHPDLFALKTLLSNVDAKLGPDRGKARFAVVVDSSLGDLPAIRERQQPILDDYYLPEWAYLMFASDAASDAAVNKLMRVVDKRASELLEFLERTGGAGTMSDAAPHARFARCYFPAYSPTGSCPDWIPAQSAPVDHLQEKLSAIGVTGS